MDTNEYQNKHYNIDQKDEGTLDDRRRDGGANFILRIKEQETRLTLHEHDDDPNTRSRNFQSRCRWEDNIKIVLQEVGCGGMNWIGLAQDRYRWRALVNAVMNLRVT
jgi:hypothetical protein